MSNFTEHTGGDADVLEATDVDVAIVGYGPVGMTMAALLGRAGHRVLVLERYAGLYNLPRAATFDDETMRTFAGLSLAEALLPTVRVQPTYDWRNATGELLMQQHFAETGRSGWAEWYMMYQPHLEEALDELCRSTPGVDVRHNSRVSGLAEEQGRVTLTVEDADGRHAVATRYVVGCDGGNSFVRAALGIEHDDYSFSEPWLVCDFRVPRSVSVPRALQLSDPSQPMSIISLGPDHHRLSFMLNSPEDFETEQEPDRVWARVENYLQPGDAELIRVATYTFRSLVAHRWRVGRTLLAGDAAHEMPPFLGQGMCSGIRDAQNVAFKLDLVLRDAVSDEVLDTYQPEREPHVRAVIEKGVELGRLQTIRDRQRAAQRDRELLARQAPGRSQDKFRFPALRDGMLSQVAGAGRGELSVHGVVDDGLTRDLLDQVVGGGFHLLVDAAMLDEADRSGRLDAARRAGIHVVTFGDLMTDDQRALTVDDVDGTYRRWFAERGCLAAVVRPDFYVFGTASDDNELTALIDEVVDILHPRERTRAREADAAFTTG